MKSNPIKSWLCALSAAATLMTLGLVPALGASINPSGTTWDCLLSGQRQGTAVFQFNSDNTFIVSEIMVPNPPNNSSSTIGRGGSGVGRGESGSSSTNIFTPNVQIFGSEETNGLWALDAKGRLIGFFVEISEPQSCSTVPIPVLTNSAGTSPTPQTFTNTSSSEPTFCVTSPTGTNVSGGTTNYIETQICYTNVIFCTAITNAISFVGTVSQKHIALKCTTPFGNTAYEGVPINPNLTDISGTYSGVRKQDGVTYQEFLTLTTSSNDFPNTYDVSLSGPGYSYTGISMLSSQKRIAFSLGLNPAIPTNTEVTVVRAVTGPFNTQNKSGNTQGWDGTQGTFNTREQFNIEFLP